MPLTAKGSEVMAKLKKEYGPESGERVFYAMKNKGTLTGVDSERVDADPFGETNGTPEDQTPIPADYGTKLDKACADAEKLMVRMGGYMDRNDGQMCNIADAVGSPETYEKKAKSLRSKLEKLKGVPAEQQHGAHASDIKRIEEEIKHNEEMASALRKRRGDSDTEAERAGIEIHGKREMVR